MIVIGWAFVLMAAALQRWSPAVAAANVEIGRGVDVLQRISIIGDMLFGGAPNNKDMITHDILSNANIITDVVNITNQPKELNITFCPDLDSLFDAYFNGFRVDLSETPWKLLTASWSRYTISERFGVSDMALSPNYQFVLVSYTRPIKMYKTVKNLTQLADLKSSVVEKFKSITIDVESKVTDFVAEFGSHYVDEYIIGDAVFQVFTYLPVFYTKFQKCFFSNFCSDTEQSVFLSPVFAEYVGEVMTIGNKGEVEKWADTNLSSKSRIGGTYTSLFMMKINPRLFYEIAPLMDDQSVLEIHLKIISIFLNDTVTNNWFTEVLDNHVKLREINL